MRDRIFAASSRALLLAGLIVGIPCVIFAETWVRRAAFVALCALAVLASRISAARSADRLAQPLHDLTARAEVAGSGSTTFEPMRSGIDEVDRLSQVFERRAGDLTRNLSAERQFASDASHQLRTPLTALLMRLEEIAVLDDIDEMHAEAAVAIEQVERLTGVVDQLLTRNRKHENDAPTSVSVDAVIAKLQRELQPTFETARRSLRVGGDRGVRVKALEAALSQILTVLLENAISHGSGTIDVSVRRSGPSVVIEVSDLGSGVDPAIAGRVFERSVTSGEGTGLGLALARDLAAANGGRLELRSASPAVFALFLSAADDADLQPS